MLKKIFAMTTMILAIGGVAQAQQAGQISAPVVTCSAPKLVGGSCGIMSSECVTRTYMYVPGGPNGGWRLYTERTETVYIALDAEGVCNE